MVTFNFFITGPGALPWSGSAGLFLLVATLRRKIRSLNVVNDHDGLKMMMGMRIKTMIIPGGGDTVLIKMMIIPGKEATVPHPQPISAVLVE